MAVYSNSDTSILCQLSLFSRLAALKSFHITKQHAYFPEHRRFLESSISVPLTASAVSCLAERWCSGLKSLRLALGRHDFTQQGLLALGQFSALESLAISVERYNPQPTQQQQQGEEPAGSSSSSSGSEPASLDVMWLPPNLTSLELSHLRLTAPRADGPVLPPVVPGAPGSGVLGRLQHLELMACHVRERLLGLVCSMASATLTSVRLVNVSGLSNEALSHLATAANLISLVVYAPRNDAVSQAALYPLRGLSALKYLSWESDDLTALGPTLELFSPFSGLRMLSLSCTRSTLVHAIGSVRALTRHMPYCYVDLVGGGGEVQVDEEEGEAAAAAEGHAEAQQRQQQQLEEQPEE